ncbi:MAG: Dabb family protein [Candidatus Omnitrophica bacterium]|nr:Dabb family protein [Candidatus Omnitrophota bacterium]
MIKHIVLWKLKENAGGRDKAANARLMKEKLEALNGKIPGMIKCEVGLDFSQTDSSADVVLYSEFHTREALDDYQDHPDHVAVKTFIMNIREERRIADYES